VERSARLFDDRNLMLKGGPETGQLLALFGLHSLTLTHQICGKFILPPTTSWPLLQTLDVHPLVLDTFLPHTPNLTSVRLLQASETVQRVLPTLQYLRTLVGPLERQKASIDHASMIATLSQCRSLTSLDLAVSAETWSQLCESLPRLEHIEWRWAFTGTISSLRCFVPRVSYACSTCTQPSRPRSSRRRRSCRPSCIR
jgi:hypothetical protein